MADRLFATFEVDRDEVARCVLEHWGIHLGRVIKASQNHTFEATSTPPPPPPSTPEPAAGDDGGSAPPADADADHRKFAVRVTPAGADDKNLARIRDELFFVHYLVSQHGLQGVCKPVPTKIQAPDATFVVRCGSLIVCVYSWAEGKPLGLLEFRWNREELVRAQGRWLASLHQGSIAFASAHPEVAGRMRQWDEMHNSVLKGTPISEEDQHALTATGKDLAGIIHGDLNLSNFFEVEKDGNVSLSVFDWDQVQHAWFEFDIAQSCLSSLMLSEGGSVPDGNPVPQVNLDNFVTWILQGYESVRGAGSVDRERFHRMLRLRKSFYSQFCKRAAEEGDIPADMAGFIAYVNRWMDKFPATL